MTVFLGILLMILKVIGILLIVLLALLVLLLLLPMGVQVRYESDKYRVTAFFGPLKFALLGGEKRAKTGTSKAQEPKKEAPVQQTESSSSKDEGSGLPTFLQRRVDAILALAKSDPVTLAERALCHGGWFFNRLLRGLRVLHMNVFWPITGDDAAVTALRYGAAITAANNLLLILRRHMKIKAESLQMEADFAAEHVALRRISFDVKTTLGILLVIALRTVRRVWVDPALRPAAKAA